jgi:tetratricopeptide (TPR) repeat protein
LSRPSRATRNPGRPGPLTVHERAFYGLLFVLAFLMPFKFGLFSLDELPRPAFGPSIGSLLYLLGSWPVEIAELLIVLAAFFWMLNMIVTRRLVFRYTKADVFLWAFLGLGLLSSFFSILPHSAVMFMKQFACWALLYHLVVNVPGGERRERALLGALLAGMMCSSLIGLHQWLVGYQQTIQQVYRFIPPEERENMLALLTRGRVMGTYASPNSLGGLYALLLPAACLFVIVMRHWTQRYGAAPAIVYGVFGPLLAFGVFILTESKGAFISVGIVAVIVTITMRHRLRIAAWKLLVVLAFAVVAVVAVTSTASGRKLIERGAHTFEERIGYWRGAARMAAHRSVARNIIGSGFNSFGVLFPKYKDPPDVVGIARYAHNNYVQLFIEVGVLGLAAFVAFWIAHLVRAGPIVAAFARGHEPLTFASLAVLAAFFGTLAFLLHSIVDFDLYVPGLAMTAMLLVGLMARHTGTVREKTLVLRKEIHAVVALAALMVITAPLVLFVPMPLTAEIHFFNADAILAGETIERPAHPHAAAVAEMRRALQWDRLNHNYMSYLAAIYAQRGLREKRLDDLDAADAWYTRALKLNPNGFAYIIRRALVRLERMRIEGTVNWDPILDEIGRAVALYPTDSFMRLLYTSYLDEAGRYDQAREQFTMAARYDEAGFPRALQTATLRYNDPAELEAFKADLERLRAKYGTAGK